MIPVADIVYRERPIPFQPDLAGAAYRGDKTQTRRVMDLNPEQQRLLTAPDLYLQQMYGISPPPGPLAFGKRGLWRIVGPDYPDGESDNVWCPYGAEGDKLWVREPWRVGKVYDPLPPRDVQRGCLIHYDADDRSAATIAAWGKYRHGRFMCRWMSRTLLQITEIRAQRLLDISREDAIAEGIERGIDLGPHPTWRDYMLHDTANVDPRWSYFSLWDKINGHNAHKANPWVWAITFRRIA